MDSSRWIRKASSDINISTKALVHSSEGKMLILKDAYSDYWDLPGGHIHQGENLEDGVIREVEEETGISIISPEQTVVREMRLGDEDRIVTFFEAETDNSEVKLSKEHTDFKWILPEEAKDYNLGVFAPIVSGNRSKSMKKSYVVKAKSSMFLPPGPPPGLPPREGLVWKPESHRWIVDEEALAPGKKKTRLIISPHAWERASTRAGFRHVRSGLRQLKDYMLPDEEWFFHVKDDGYVVGKGRVVKSVLSGWMNPKGTEISSARQ